MRKKILNFLQTHNQNQFRKRDLIRRLRVRIKNRDQFNQSLADLVREGLVQRIKGNKYTLLRRDRPVEGKLTVTQKGFGFVITDDDRPDIFIGRRSMQDAIHGDQVEVRLHKKSPEGRLRGRIIRIITRGTDRFIGTVIQEGINYWLEIAPITPVRGIRVIKRSGIEFTSGQIIIAKVKDWGTSLTPIVVVTIDVIGDAEDPQNDFRTVLEKHGYSSEFPTAVQAVANRLTSAMIEHESPNRKDLRHLKTLTIDPLEARDFDDALSIVETKSGYQLGVHIADVSHFVTQGTALDREAFQRGTSVYFTEGVVHMLPERLSADLCSLKLHEDRLTLSALIDLDQEWKVTRFEIVPAVIRNDHRFTYREVQAVLNGEVTHQLESTLKLLGHLSEGLSRQRSELGSIDFDIPEPIFTLGEKGIPHEILPSERLQSHRIVEECMLLANRLVAERFGSRNGTPVPFIYRIHDKPAPDDVEQFLLLLKRLNLQIGSTYDPSTSKGLRDILASIEDSPFKNLIETIALRTMTKAKYAISRRGHFGLAFKQYTHFTSPIRRYPDLAVHRRIKQLLLGENKANEKELNTFLQSVTDTANEMELKALEAEREYIKIKQLRWLKTHLGEKFKGIVSGVVYFGFFVELEASMAEGLVHIDTLEDDQYIYDEDHYSIRGRRYQSEFRLGDPVNIRVQSVTFEKQRANFVLEN